MRRLFIILAMGCLGLQGCVVGTAVSVAGNVVEGAVNTTAFAVKTTGQVAGAIIPDGDNDDDEDNDDNEDE